jgi:hypothetical protein
VEKASGRFSLTLPLSHRERGDHHPARVHLCALTLFHRDLTRHHCRGIEPGAIEGCPECVREDRKPFEGDRRGVDRTRACCRRFRSLNDAASPYFAFVASAGMIAASSVSRPDNKLSGPPGDTTVCAKNLDSCRKATAFSCLPRRVGNAALLPTRPLVKSFPFCRPIDAQQRGNPDTDGKTPSNGSMQESRPRLTIGLGRAKKYRI